MAKNLITTIQVNLGRLVLAQNSPELSLLKFLTLTYHHSHFLATTLDFTSFFTIAFLRAALFFLQLGCFDLYHFLHYFFKHLWIKLVYTVCPVFKKSDRSNPLTINRFHLCCKLTRTYHLLHHLDCSNILFDK